MVEWWQLPEIVTGRFIGGVREVLVMEGKRM